ncbi:MAG: 30S ribosomal protein S8 [Candidatus Omnitrophica bacterium]|nr:30S ribosomal protein S8 [Candidatus Omnitrophota bacterium]MBU1924847.1 30S ribosomal protein S8 [Candidatus Omnitrophota bacterium]
MSITDPIADMLAVINTAQRVKKEKTDVPASKVKEEILKIMKENGYIVDYRRIEDGRQGLLRVYLRYASNKNKDAMISGMRRISKPGRRMYVNYEKIPYVYGGTGLAVLSTSRGIMTGKQARQTKIGGEILCYVW